MAQMRTTPKQREDVWAGIKSGLLVEIACERAGVRVGEFLVCILGDYLVLEESRRDNAELGKAVRAVFDNLVSKY